MRSTLIFLIPLLVDAQFSVPVLDDDVGVPCPQVSDGGCSICGPDLCVTNNDAIFKFGGQPAVRCDVLEQVGLIGDLPVEACTFLPLLVNEVCDCRPTRPDTSTPTPSTLSPTTLSVQSCPEVLDGGCSICGSGLCTTNYDAIFEFPGQPAVRCDSLEQVGLNGGLPDEGCNLLPALVEEVCGCQAARPNSSTPIPTISPVLGTTCPEVPDEGCSICGPDLCVTNYDAIFEFADQPPVRCDLLEQAGLTGELPDDGCSFLPLLVKDVCGCGTTPPVAPPKVIKVVNYIAEVFPDPHFRTWHNYHYSYHGSCDMVFMKNSLIDLHIRTENSSNDNRGFWSTPSSAAIRVGTDIVEVTQDRKIFYNSNRVTATAPLNIIRETHHIWKGLDGITVFLSGGHFIFIQALDYSPSSNLQGIMVRASIPGPGFHGVYRTPYPETKGMGGTWGKFGLVGRDGKVLSSVDSFAQNWEVGIDDPIILRPRKGGTFSCMDRPVVLPNKFENDFDEAEKRCLNVLEDYRSECLFDAWITKSFAVKENPVYNFALDTYQEPRCSANNLTCHYIGGHCMVGCDRTKTDCYPDLCSGTGNLNELGIELQLPSGGDIVSSCSCMVEFTPATYPPSPVPSTAPSASLVPTKSPMPSSIPSSSPTNSPAPTATPEVGLCFSESNLIKVDDERGVIKMKDLRLGDYVLARNGKYEKVYSYGHFEPNTKAQYLEIFCSDNHHPLEVTENHMIFTSDNKAIPASNLCVGDKIISGSGNPIVIKSIRRVIRVGLYAPLTQSGTVVVNDVLASCYMAYESSDSMKLVADYKLPYQYTCHLFFAPLRMYCKVASTCDSQTYSMNGLSHWTDLPLNISLWLHRQSTIIKTLLIAIYLAIYVPLGVLESILDSSFLCLIILFTGVLLFSIKLLHRNKIRQRHDQG